MVAKIIFWVSVGLILYVFAGYPLLLWLLQRMFRRKQRRDDEQPTVSLLIPAHNEAAVIAEKIANSLALDYPSDRLEIVVASDGSTDSTAQIVHRLAQASTPGRVRLLDFPVNRGKIAVLNDAVPLAEGDIVIFTDASSMLAPEAVRRLVANFADRSVGAASGVYRVLNPQQASLGAQEALYWRYETFLKLQEAQLGSMLGAHGSLFAIRKPLFPFLPPATINDDFLIPLRVVEQGYRVAYEPSAVAYEQAREMEGFGRRVRIAAGNVEQLVEAKALLWPPRPMLLFCFLSHKAGRLLVPIAMLAAMAATLALWGQPFYTVMALAQILFYTLAILGAFFPLKPRWLRLPYYFSMINGAVFAWIYHAVAFGQIIPSRREMDQLGRAKSKSSPSVLPAVEKAAAERPLPADSLDSSVPVIHQSAEHRLDERTNAGNGARIGPGVSQSEARPSPPEASFQVSVIIPAYQAADYIAQTLHSVFAQTFTNFEVLLVNDGSPDADQLERALQPFSDRIRYLKQENRGPSAARNAAIRQAQGKYLAFLDSDDFWLPHHLASQIELLERNSELKLVYADAILLMDDAPIGRAFEISASQSGPVTFETLVRESCTVNTSSAVASRQAVVEAGVFDETMHRCEDLDLWLRMCHRGARMDYRPNPQVCHRIRNGLAADRELMKQAHIAVYRKALSVLPVTSAERATLERCIRTIEGELHLERAKRRLLDKHYAEALSETREANAILNSWKLRMAITGIRHVPGLFRQSYGAYQKILLAQQQRNRLSAKQRIHVELPVPVKGQREDRRCGNNEPTMSAALER
jgi:cellulose synthase/poly-beta-1,6-N-acetylglucosamine synthase-like glycosyltransferase